MGMDSVRFLLSSNGKSSLSNADIIERLKDIENEKITLETKINDYKYK